MRACSSHSGLCCWRFFHSCGSEQKRIPDPEDEPGNLRIPPLLPVACVTIRTDEAQTFRTRSSANQPRKLALSFLLCKTRTRLPYNFGWVVCRSYSENQSSGKN